MSKISFFFFSEGKVDFSSEQHPQADVSFAKWLSKNRKLQGIPPSAFFSQDHKHIGEDYIRFCFIKVCEAHFKNCLALSNTYNHIFLLQKEASLAKAREILMELKKEIS